jgi:hypothetical protein
MPIRRGMHMRWKRKAGCLLLAVVAFAEITALQLGPLVSTAHAVVGRPLTPVSYAGVARRTSRRTTRRNVAYGAYPGVW